MDRETFIQPGRSAIALVRQITGRIMGATVETATSVSSSITEALPDQVTERLEYAQQRVMESSITRRALQNPLIQNIRGVVTSQIAELQTGSQETTTSSHPTSTSAAPRSTASASRARTRAHTSSQH